MKFSAQVSPKANSKAAEARRFSENMRNILIGYREMLEGMLPEHSLTLAQLRLLKAVDEQSQSSSAAIARTCQVTPQTLQAMLIRAVRQGWIVRGHTETNQRIVTARLTQSGKTMLSKGRAAAAIVEARLWKGTPLAELRQLNQQLQRAAANFDLPE